MSKSAVTKIIRDTRDYTSIDFNLLLERQNNSRRRYTISQLGKDGFGYICLQNKDLDFHQYTEVC
jgi:hypothetical protein